MTGPERLYALLASLAVDGKVEGKRTRELAEMMKSHPDTVDHWLTALRTVGSIQSLRNGTNLPSTHVLIAPYVAPEIGQRKQSPEMYERVRNLWNEGLSANKIANILGITKNAVMGIKTRAGLPSRGSPIKQKGVTSAKKEKVVEERRVTKVFKPPTVIFGNYFAPKVHPKVAPPPRRFVVGAAKTCQYPLGDVREPGFRFCEEPSFRHLSYCEKHAEVCYLNFAAIKSKEAA